jgi:hypothetical protein
MTDYEHPDIACGGVNQLPDFQLVFASSTATVFTPLGRRLSR